MAAHPIMIIDDSPVVCNLIKVHLLNFDCDYVNADRPVFALTLLRAVPIDLIITDFHMEAMDGIEFIKIVRSSERPHIRSVPTVLMTDDHNSDIQERAFRAGANGFLPKPINGLRLRQIVAELLGITDESSASTTR